MGLALRNRIDFGSVHKHSPVVRWDSTKPLFINESTHSLLRSTQPASRLGYVDHQESIPTFRPIDLRHATSPV